MECPYCHEKVQDNLPTFHYPGLKGSTHIECQTCGMEFSVQEAQQAAEASKRYAQD
jgi:DNA-directed RNA polymerase subunit RPC12/RpoP